MRLKRFVAPDSIRAMRKIKETLGEDAVILSSHTVDEGVEIVAAIDYDESVINKRLSEHDSIPVVLPNENTSPLPKRDISKPESSSNINDLKNEINLLKELIENQLAGFAWQHISHYEPMQMLLLKRLGSLGFDINACSDLVKTIDEKRDYQKAWLSLMTKMLNSLQIASSELINDSGTYAFIGPTGVGKTTTIAKIAARYTLQHDAESLGLITMDSFRIAAHEQLVTYGKILNVDVSVVDNLASLKTALAKFKHKRLILIDTAGANPRDSRVQEMLSLFDNCGREIRKVLVVSATNQSAVLEEAFSLFGNERLSNCVLTKLDESKNVGSVLSVLLERQVPISYLSNGQRVPEDIEMASKAKILKILVDSQKHYTNSKDVSDLVAKISGEDRLCSTK